MPWCSTVVKHLNFKAINNASIIIVKSQVKAERAGGIETIVKAMSIHIDDANISYAGCDALLNMSFKNSKSIMFTDKLTANKYQLRVKQR